MIVRKLSAFFWDIDYPTRSFTRILVLISLVIYTLARMVNPTPIWAQEAIELITHKLNLEFIQEIGLLGQYSNSAWRGNGFALQMQLICTWPLYLILGLVSGYLNKNGSKEFEKYPPIIKVPSLKNWLKNLIVVMLILCLFYYPLHGSNLSHPYTPNGSFSRIQFDTYTTSIFWIMAGWVLMYLTMIGIYIINVELKASLKSV